MGIPFVRHDQEKMLEAMSCRYMTRDRRLSYKNRGCKGGKSRSQPYMSFAQAMRWVSKKKRKKNYCQRTMGVWQIEVCKEASGTHKEREYLTNHDAYFVRTKHE